MFIDARRIGPSTTETVDLCIIGAAAAGISIVTEFLDSRHSVCLIEGGGIFPEPCSQKLYLGTTIPEWRNQDTKRTLRHVDGYLVGSRLRAFGGTMHLWTGMCRQLERMDFTHRP